ncbi:aldo/keto reductase [Nitrospinota bacterium]
MEKRTLGNTGLEVTAVGFGAMVIGGRFGPVDDTESNRALHAAVDGGMNFIDTSNAYGEGRSENLIGKFLKERSDRDELILCTKGGNNFVALEGGSWGRDFTPGFIGKCLEESLGRLGVEAIGLYLLHNPTLDDMKAEDCYALLEKAKDGGKLKAWGVSINTVEECDYAIESGKPTLLQMEYNILQQEAADSFKRANAAGVGVICRVPLKRGFLSGKIDETVEFTEGDMRRRILTPENIRKFQDKLNRLRDVAGQLNITPAEAALRFCVSNPDVSTAIPGIRTAEQASQNARCGEPLPIEAIKRLEED